MSDVGEEWRAASQLGQAATNSSSITIFYFASDHNLATASSAVQVLSLADKPGIVLAETFDLRGVDVGVDDAFGAPHLAEELAARVGDVAAAAAEAVAVTETCHRRQFRGSGVDD